MRSRLAMVCFLVLSCLPLLAAPFTPLAWRGEIRRSSDPDLVVGKMTSWNRDADHDFIDDALAGRDPAEKVDIIVDFNRCVTCCKEGTEEEVLTYLRKIGTVDFIGRVLTYAVVTDVPVAELPSIANRKEVAMVEWLAPAGEQLAISRQAVRAGAGHHSPNTVDDAFPAIKGNGVAVAVLDSGVDNVGSGTGTKNNMFPAGTFVAGANCLTDPCTITDPNDDSSHGTHVAGIVLGRPLGCAGGTCRGMAPAANLVDIKIVNADGWCVGASCMRGLELAIAKREEWDIKVINLSIGNCVASNGQNAAAQLINHAVARGMTVAVAVGNTVNCGAAEGASLINDWASASLAITVGAIDDRDTPQTGDDLLAKFSFRGRRLSDGDNDPRDEKKPELAAPGKGIVSACYNSENATVSKDGTSMAAPHVAGVAALVQQRFPDITPGALKELLIATVAAQSNSPVPPPGHDPGWGFGFLNAHRALSHAHDSDVGRPSEPPYFPCNESWCSPYISTATPPQLDVPNTIRAQVRNFSAVPVASARVCFGVYSLSNNFSRFFELGCVEAALPALQTTVVPFAWTPSRALWGPAGGEDLPAGEAIHACIKVSVDYPFDTNFANNEMQRNVAVTQTAPGSPVRLPFRVENNVTVHKEIELRVESQSNWPVRILLDARPIDKPVFAMDPESCPKDLVVEIEPPEDAREGETATFLLRTIADDEDFGGAVVNVTVANKP